MVHERQTSSVFPFYLGLQFLGPQLEVKFGVAFLLGSSIFFGPQLAVKLGVSLLLVPLIFFWAIVGTQVLERHEHISIRTQFFIPVCLLHVYKILLCGRPATTLCPFSLWLSSHHTPDRNHQDLAYFHFSFSKLNRKTILKFNREFNGKKCSISKINHFHFQSKNQPCIFLKKNPA